MTPPEPIYTPENCRPSYHLTWTLSLFWHAPMHDAGWLEELKAATEKDGVRTLEHRFARPGTSQFLISTSPSVSPASVIRSVKGRLQHIVRGSRPNAFRRNYSIRSLGSAKREVVERYVSSQLDHHQMADPRVQEMLKGSQIHREEVDLSHPRRTSYGEYIYNLHVVIVNDKRWMEVRQEVLAGTHRMLLGTSGKKGHLLSRAGIFADHLHLAVGCGIRESPQEVALGYMNNLAYAQGMRPVFQFGFYVGTFGEYDFGALKV